MVLFAIGMFGGFRFLMPKIVRVITELHAGEVLVLGALVLCFGAAWLASLIGLSLALGAFMAGMVIASTDGSHRISRTIDPCKAALNDARNARLASSQPALDCTAVSRRARPASFRSREKAKYCASGIQTSSTACCAALATTSACGSAMPTSSAAQMTMRRARKRMSSPATSIFASQ